MKIAKIGDMVNVKGHGSREVKDIAFLDSFLDPTLGSVGVLHYNCAGTGWVLHTEVEVPDEFFDLDAIDFRLQELGEKMVGWMGGLPDRPDNQNLIKMVPFVLAIQYDKEGSYGSSWKGKGEYRGIMGNIDRKYDRLDKITQDEISGKRRPLPTSLYENLTAEELACIGESKIDAIFDLAVYSLLYMTWMMETYPGAFRVWIDRNVPAYLRDKVLSVLK